jgi:predicted metal-dependent HD superfamily phosphohydrolase
MNIIKQTEGFVYTLLKDKLSNSFLYHNFNHTSTVVKAVEEIVSFSNIDENQKEKLLIAAWFHDVGYIEGAQNHEDRSAKIASDFLLEKGFDAAYIESVSKLIKATKMEFIPTTVSEQIIKDADYYHFITKEYIENSELLKKEWEITQDKNFSELEWLRSNLDMLSNCHQFYSAYALKHWQSKKEKNIAKLLKRINKLTMEHNESRDIEAKKKAKEERVEKSVDTMFKTTLTNHIRLSEIADSKANILLSVNAIIISIALSTLIPKLDSPSNAHLIVPTFLMVLFSVICIIFAILSTKPKVTSGKFTRKDIEDKKVNLLFFGNFFKMPFEEFEWAMKELISDKDYLHNSMIKDLYYLGLVLERKYRLLRLTYNTFMFGIIISVIAFVVAFKLS